MNSDEKMNALKQGLTLIFGMLTVFAPQLATSQQYSALTTAVMTAVPAVVAIYSVCWSIYSHWNMKKVAETAVVKTVAAVLVLACMLALDGGTVLGPKAAYAADVPPPIVTKAPVTSNPSQTANGSGWYVGIETEASVANSSVSGNNTFASGLLNSSLYSAGGAVGGEFGYIWGSANGWYRVAVRGDYQNVTGSVAAAGAAATLASRWSAAQEVDIGVSGIQNLLTALPQLGLTNPFPTFNPPAFANINASAPRPYVGVGLREFGVSGSFGNANGATVSVAPMATAGNIWQVLTSAGKPTGQAFDIAAFVAWPTKGFTLNNAIAPGQPPTLGAAANLGTMYGVMAKYDFGI